MFDTNSIFSSDRQSKSIAITSMAFPKNEINNFVLGSEDGNVYSGEWNSKYYNESECHGIITILQVKWNKDVAKSQMARYAMITCD